MDSKAPSVEAPVVESGGQKLKMRRRVCTESDDSVIIIEDDSSMESEPKGLNNKEMEQLKSIKRRASPVVLLKKLPQKTNLPTVRHELNTSVAAPTTVQIMDQQMPGSSSSSRSNSINGRMTSKSDSNSDEGLDNLPPGALESPGAKATVAKRGGKKLKNANSPTPVFQSGPTSMIRRKKARRQDSTVSDDSVIIIEDESSMGSEPKVLNHKEKEKLKSIKQRLNPVVLLQKLPLKNYLPTLRRELNTSVAAPATVPIMDQPKPSSSNPSRSNSTNIRRSNRIRERKRLLAVMQLAQQLIPSIQPPNPGQFKISNEDSIRHNSWYATQLEKLVSKLRSQPCPDEPVPERKNKTLLERMEKVLEVYLGLE